MRKKKNVDGLGSQETMYQDSGRLSEEHLQVRQVYKEITLDSD